MTSVEDPLLGTVFVIGGCGFLGFHLVAQLLREPDCGSVYVLDRTLIPTNMHDLATYISGSITDAALIHSLLNKFSPRTIFHLASPDSIISTDSDLHSTNVTGTSILLDAASQTASIKAFIFTSSIDIYASPPHINITETHPLVSSTSHPSAYNRTKAAAHRLVLAANSPSLPTVALISAHHYGPRDTQSLPAILDMALTDHGKPKPLAQLGDGTNLFEVVGIANAASAHILAARCLLDPTRAAGPVAGEAFNISDNRPVPFWRHLRTIWEAAGALRPDDKLFVIPAWVALQVAWLLEWLFWLGTAGYVKPPVNVRREGIEFAVWEHTYCGEKARRVLGWRPEEVGGGFEKHDEVIGEAVAWELERRMEKRDKKGKKDL